MASSLLIPFVNHRKKLIATYLIFETRHDFGALVLGLVIVGVLIGFDFAELGSFLGKLVRRWALRK